MTIIKNIVIKPVLADIKTPLFLLDKICRIEKEIFDRKPSRPVLLTFIYFINYIFNLYDSYSYCLKKVIKYILNIYPYILNLIRNDCIGFIKSLIKYLINKHWYKLNKINFILKTYISSEGYKFFKQKRLLKCLFGEHIYKLNKIFGYLIDILKQLGPFIKQFILYLISKYYYKLNEIDFIIKSYTDPETFNFFVKLTKLKSFFIKEKCYSKSITGLLYTYTVLLLGYVYIAPVGFMFVYVVTDPMNWIKSCLAQTNLSCLS